MTIPSALSLAPVLDTAAAGPLRLALRKTVEQSEPLFIDGSAVERVGLASLQVLAAGRVAAANAGLVFLIADPSPAFADMARLAGCGELAAA